MDDGLQPLPGSDRRGRVGPTQAPAGPDGRRGGGRERQTERKERDDK